MPRSWIACLAAITSVAVAPLSVLAQAGSNSGDKPAAKPPVGDFDPPRNMQIQIIEDGPVVHDYRSAPHAPVIQEPWKNAAYEGLWKSTCETNPDIQFVVKKLSVNDQGKAHATRWLADLASPSTPRAYRVYPNPDVDYESDPRPCNKPDGRNRKKQFLQKSEFIALRSMVLQVKERLDKAYAQYLSSDEQASKLARPALLEMAGPAAVERLDRTIADHHRSNVIPTGPGSDYQTRGHE
jgi:hypothetical protein